MSRRVVSFVLGGSRWGVPASSVVQVVRHEGLQRAPRAHSFVSGVIVVRGDVVPVVDLRQRLGVASASGDRRSGDRRRILVVRHAGRICGLAVDEVRELVDLPEGAVTPATESAATAAGTAEVAHLPDGELLLPDLKRLLDPSEAP